MDDESTLPVLAVSVGHTIRLHQVLFRSRIANIMRDSTSEVFDISDNVQIGSSDHFILGGFIFRRRLGPASR